MVAGRASGGPCSGEGPPGTGPALTIALCVVLLLTSLAVAITPPARGAESASGLTLVSSEPAERGEILTLWSPALAAETKVRVLLPAGYSDDPDRTSPVLYLLHGGAGSWQSWTEPGGGEAVERTASSPFVVVMPDGGAEGWYTDNYGWGEGGPRWETYHVGELVPFVDARYRTAPGRRATAGLSMGGYGALEYAARHPELFEAAASFSGADDLTFLGPLSVWGLAAFELAPHQVTAGMIWGDIMGDQVRVRTRNPADLAANLGHTRLFLRWGDGREVGPGMPDIRRGIGEMFLAAMNESFLAKLSHAGGSADVVRRHGTHAWKYWREDLTASLPSLEAAVAPERPAPERFDYVSADPTFSAWGWDVTMTRPVLEFAELRDAGRDGFVARGTGEMHVRTAAAYCAGATYTISQTRREKTSGVSEEAGPDGRLRVDVDLGPPHRLQDWTILAAMLRNALGDAYLERADVTVTGPSPRDCR